MEYDGSFSWWLQKRCFLLVLSSRVASINCFDFVHVPYAGRIGSKVSLSDTWANFSVRVQEETMRWCSGAVCSLHSQKYLCSFPSRCGIFLWTTYSSLTPVIIRVDFDSGFEIGKRLLISSIKII